MGRDTQLESQAPKAQLRCVAQWICRQTLESEQAGFQDTPLKVRTSAILGEKEPPKHGLGGGTNARKITHPVHFKSKHPAAQTLSVLPEMGRRVLGCQITVSTHPPCYSGCLHHLCLWNQGQVQWEPTPSWHLYPHTPPLNSHSNPGCWGPISER